MLGLLIEFSSWPSRTALHPETIDWLAYPFAMSWGTTAFVWKSRVFLSESSGSAESKLILCGWMVDRGQIGKKI